MEDATRPLLPSERAPSSASLRHHIEPPDLLGDTRQWHANTNLDVFFTRLYKYWQEKGFRVIVVSRVLHLLTLAFTIFVFGALLFFFNWQGLGAKCLRDDTCDILSVDAAIYSSPWRQGEPLGNALKVLFLGIFCLYLAYSALVAAIEIRQFADVQDFCRNRMGIADAHLAYMPWPELLHRVVALQRNVRLSLRGELSEHDVVMRIMRRDDYLIGMLNMGVLDLDGLLPCLRRRPLVTTAVAAVLDLCLLQPMFDASFMLRPAFLRDGAHLRRRLRAAAVASALLSPFLLTFLVMHYSLKHLERVYHHPSSLGKRRWSLFAYWRMRELGELPHFVEKRLHSAAAAATKYCQQFPSPIVSAAAGFIAYVTASAAALVIVVALTHDWLAERHAFGHTLVWWLAAAGLVLAAVRGAMEDEAPAYDPEAAMTKVCLHTHWVPLYWRGRAHTASVRADFQGLFQLQVAIAAQELVSVLLLPWLCAVALPRCADDVAKFLRDCTTYHQDAGHICSMAAFDLDRHGNPRYGGPEKAGISGRDAPRNLRARQGKVEKSLLSFAACYPTWKPSNAHAAEFVARCAHRADDAAGVATGGAAEVPGVAIPGQWALVSQAQPIQERSSLGSALSMELQRVGEDAARARRSRTGAVLGGFDPATTTGGGGGSRGSPASTGRRASLAAVAARRSASLRAEASEPSMLRRSMRPEASDAAAGELSGSWRSGAGEGLQRQVAESPLAATGRGGAEAGSSGSDRRTESFEEMQSSSEAARLAAHHDTFAGTAPPQRPWGAATAWASRPPADRGGVMSRSLWAGAGRGAAEVESRMGVFQGAEARQLALHRALQLGYEEALPEHQRARLAASTTSFYSAHSR